MRANRVPGKAKRTIGTMVIDFDNCPFEADEGNDFEEMLLHYLPSISNTLINIEAVTSGELDNPVVVRLYDMESALLSKLDEVINELKQHRSGGCTCG